MHEYNVVSHRLTLTSELRYKRIYFQLYYEILTWYHRENQTHGSNKCRHETMISVFVRRAQEMLPRKK